MSTIQSPVKKIQELRIESLPSGKPVKAVKVLRVDRTTFVIAANGRVYCDLLKRHGFYTLGNYRWTLTVLRGLRRLGLITQDDLQAHLDAAKVRDAERTISCDRREHFGHWATWNFTALIPHR